MKGTLYSLMCTRKNNKGPEQSLVVHRKEEQQVKLQGDQCSWNILHCCFSQQSSYNEFFVIPWLSSQGEVLSDEKWWEKKLDGNIATTLMLCVLKGVKNNGRQRCLGNCEKWHILKRGGSFKMNAINSFAQGAITELKLSLLEWLMCYLQAKQWPES